MQVAPLKQPPNHWQICQSRLINPISYSGFWVALGGSIMAWITPVLWQYTPSIPPVIATGFGAWAVYLADRLLEKQAAYAKRHTWLQEYKPFAWLWVAICTTIGCIAANQLQATARVTLLLGIGASACYVIKDTWLKKSRYLKTFSITSTWCIATILVPLLDLELSWQPNLWIWCLLQWLLFVALTLPSDWLDRQHDNNMQLQNHAMQFGFKKLKACCIYAWGLWLVGHLLLPHALPAICGGVLLGLIWLMWQANRKRWFYDLAIDGFMVLYGMIVLTMVAFA